MTKLLMSWLSSLHRDEAGQGLVEYVLVIALIALAATAGMSGVATSINSAFTKIGSIIGNYVS
jgi:pilus assembly protein Flp/PilA